MYVSTVRKEALLYIAWGKLEYLAKFHIKFPFDSTVPLLRTHLGDVLVKVGKKKCTELFIVRFFSSNNKRPERTQMSINRILDMETT